MEADALTLDRFVQLAGAYGGDIARWPPEERGASFAFADAQPTETAPILAAAAALDIVLNASPTPVASLALRDAVVASAPRRRPLGMRRPWVAVGASLAAASVGGLLAGAFAAPNAVPHGHLTADTTGDAARWLGEPADVLEG